MKLKFKGDPSRLTWGRPDSVPSVLCSYCSAVIPEDSVPLIMFNPEGWTIRLCDQCVPLCVEVET